MPRPPPPPPTCRAILCQCGGRKNHAGLKEPFSKTSSSTVSMGALQASVRECLLSNAVYSNGPSNTCLFRKAQSCSVKQEGGGLSAKTRLALCAIVAMPGRILQSASNSFKGLNQIGDTGLETKSTTINPHLRVSLAVGALEL